tara:strand:+ start:318 stop:494 length:177 start_codon:yes stop_codon:yes gene_type:complete
MNIESAKYTKDPFTDEKCAVTVVVDGKPWSVNIGAVGNVHWDALQEWVADGNEIAEAD